MKFKIGDRVKIYDICKVTHQATVDTGWVVGINDDEYASILVQCDTWKNSDHTAPEDEHGNYFHSKQLRRLKPKKKKIDAIWINWEPTDYNEEKFIPNIVGANGTISIKQKDGWIKFVRAQ